MSEDEFDSFAHFRPFRSEDAMHLEAGAGRCTTLGVALWGRTSDDLQRQLNAPHPEIPSDCDLADLRKLQSIAHSLATALANPWNTWLSPLVPSSPNIFVGNQRFTAWEARCEVVRRAIEYLEKR